MEEDGTSTVLEMEAKEDTLTKVAKDTERSYIVLQPGFKIKKSKLVANTKKSDIVFDATIPVPCA